MTYTEDDAKSFFEYVAYCDNYAGAADMKSMSIVIDDMNLSHRYDFSPGEFLMVMNGWLPEKFINTPREDLPFFNDIIKFFQAPMIELPLHINTSPKIVGWRLRNGI